MRESAHPPALIPFVLPTYWWYCPMAWVQSLACWCRCCCCSPVVIATA